MRTNLQVNVVSCLLHKDIQYLKFQTRAKVGGSNLKQEYVCTNRHGLEVDHLSSKLLCHRPTGLLQQILQTQRVWGQRTPSGSTISQSCVNMYIYIHICVFSMCGCVGGMLAYSEGGKDDSLHLFSVSSPQHITQDSSHGIPVLHTHQPSPQTS